MRRLPLITLIVMAMTSCGGNSDCGRTFTHVNKAMAPFGEDGKAVIFSTEGEGQIENMYLCGDFDNWHHPGQCLLNVYCDGMLCVSGKLYELACLNMDYRTRQHEGGNHIQWQETATRRVFQRHKNG